MPYNTTAIPPRTEVTGQSALPLARVKKIISQDPDIDLCSNNAAFVITVATEMFIQHLATEAQTMAKLERKPRRNVQYKDLANAVAHNDHLEFLEDVIPKTVSYKKIKNQASVTRANVQGEDDLQEGRKAKRTGGGGGASRSVSGPGPSAAATGSGSASASAFAALANGSGKKKHRPSSSGVNGLNGTSLDDPNAQLEAEMQQAADERDRDGDVDMTG